jgi:hypothetical protein
MTKGIHCLLPEDQNLLSLIKILLTQNTHNPGFFPW